MKVFLKAYQPSDRCEYHYTSDVMNRRSIRAFNHISLSHVVFQGIVIGCVTDASRFDNKNIKL